MASTTITKCPSPMKATSNGVFQGDSPLDYAVPLAILQICLVLVLTRVLAFILSPLRQPRVIAEIIEPHSIRYFGKPWPPLLSFPCWDRVRSRSLRRTGKKALIIALAGISLPFTLGIGTSCVLRGTIAKGVSQGPFLIFMGISLSITAFPVLARILAELKLLTTDVGQMAMSAAAINDVAAWILLALAISLSGASNSPLISVWVLLCGTGFMSCFA
ncbi:hypothetical protein H5410_039942 [Solanum commersonii]|uniref:Cation/H+ exchanger transmembrane domain-containing protein n=1 Tax=Solanum commersonii TaxID=4109 RepID=A0A9J5XPZ6_SOLCO|nr:hypothetical protein H5410_039942 [Solanum commersonii]